MPQFPLPTYFGRRRYWRLSELLAYEAASAGKPTPEPADAAAERYLPASAVRERYGVSHMWFQRRLAERDGAPEAA